MSGCVGGGAPGSRHEPACISQRPSKGGALGAQVLLGRALDSPEVTEGASRSPVGRTAPPFSKRSQDGLRARPLAVPLRASRLALQATVPEVAVRVDDPGPR